MLKSSDLKGTIGILQDKLEFNVSDKYTTWEDFISEYKKLWSVFTKNISENYNVKDITLRYINEFDIPMSNWYEHLLTRTLIVTDTISDKSTVDTFQTTSHHTLISREYEAISDVIVQIAAKDDINLKVTFDVNIVSQKSVENYKNFEQLSSIFQQIRQFKNKIFFANIPHAQELFK